jgi:Recombinase
MPRKPTGNPLGRPPKYSEDEHPVTVSLRIPRELAGQMKRYASLHRQSVTELLLDGLRWRLGEDDPRGLGIDLPHEGGQNDNGYYGNTDMSAPMLEEIRTALARQETRLQALVQALEQRPVVSVSSVDYGNTTKESVGQQNTSEPVREANGRHAPQEEYAESSNTVLQEDRNVAARDTAAQQPDMPDKAALVARLHQMRASGLSLSQIAGQLQAEGLPTLSGKGQWQKGTVDKLLRSQAQSQAQPT